MKKFIVHLYREMRLDFTDIEADTPQAAAAIACVKPTDDADNIEDCEGENLAALVDVAGDEDYRQSVTIDFDAERQRKAAPKLLAALQDIVVYQDFEKESFLQLHEKHGITPSIAGEKLLARLLDNARNCIAEANAAGIIPAKIGDPPAGKPFSVLLLYPDHLDDTGYETYYALVEAADAIEAIALAQRQAVAAQVAEIDDPTDFAPLLVTEGHHASEPLFNK